MFAVALLFCVPGAAADEPPLPFWRVATVSGSLLGCLDGAPESGIEMLACHEACAPIPWQLEERTAAGERALGQGPEPTVDESPGIIDEHDEIVWMAADGGRRMRADERPATTCLHEIEVRAGDRRAWVYAAVVPPPARRSPVRYVEYDAGADVVRAGRMALGFGAPTPRYFAVREGAEGAFGPNLLDRLKIRASARFLGLVPLGRDEDDIEWVFGAWQAGPIRVVRREWQWVRLGWGLRTPIFQTESIISRDAAELPVRLRLNFPPSYFFGHIEVQAALDCRDLRGWRVRAPAIAAPVGALTPSERARLDGAKGDWIALQGPAATIVLRLRLGDSFASLRCGVLYRENAGGFGPESVPGEHPAIGFRLTEWGQVDRGHHWFAAIATALPLGSDVEQFLREEALPLAIDARDVAP